MLAMKAKLVSERDNPVVAGPSIVDAPAAVVVKNGGFLRLSIFPECEIIGEWIWHLKNTCREIRKKNFRNKKIEILRNLKKNTKIHYFQKFINFSEIFQRTKNENSLFQVDENFISVLCFSVIQSNFYYFSAEPIIADQNQAAAEATVVEVVQNAAE